ncbi:MAG TPA: hypothetical protein VKZ79_24040 [Alphaproteobacteria bacterium]|nr:hypothetical protein [Alphaproteobacteria bacterium]
MFGPWEPFYQMTGEVAATLIGLLFIVITLTSSRPSSGVTSGMRLFTTPTLFHLVSVLVISALALAPDGDDGIRAAAMLVWALLGLIYAIGRFVGLRGIAEPTHWSDSWYYGVAPSVVYLALAAAASLALAGFPHAVSFVAICLMALLLVIIRNAWDLVTWLAPRRDSH